MLSSLSTAHSAKFMPRLLLAAAILPMAAAAATEEPQLASELEEVVVVGSRLPTEIYRIGRAITVLDEVRIDDLGYEYGADLFRFVPGVAVNRSGGYGGVAQLRIRGSEGNHSVVLIDGIDVSSAGTGEFDVSSLLSSDIERIEVLRGPQSGLFGSNALSGVVNVVTRRPEAGLVLDGQLETGEHDTRHGSVSLAGGSQSLRARVTYTQRRSKFNLAETGSEADEDDNRTVSGRLLFDPADHLSFEVFGRRTEKDSDTDAFDFTGGPQQGTLVDDDSFSNSRDASFGTAATVRLADGRSISRLAAARTDTELDGGTFGSEADRDDIRLDSTWLWGEESLLQQRTTVFLQWEEETFRNTRPFDVSQVAAFERELFGYGVEHRIAVNGALFINANVRRDINDEFDDSTTYAVDVSYRMPETGTRVHTSFGKAVTNPTFFEQFGFVPGNFLGNPDLMPEASEGWDVGIEQTFFDSSLVVDLTYFAANLNDEIQLLFPSVSNVDGESDRKGIELSAHWMPTEQTSLVGSYTYTDAEEPGGEELRRPQHMASLSIAHALLDNRLRLAAGLVYNGEMLDNDFRNFYTNGFVSERTKLDSYTLVNMHATYDVSEELELFVRVENLFDEDYQENIGYATPGRAAYAGVRYRLRN